MIAVLGLGLLGRGFAERFLETGHPLRVWNRTASKADGLHGATVCATPAEAVAGVERVHLVLAEDHAVDAVIEAFVDALPAGVPIIDHSTNSPGGVRARIARLAERGVRYVHAPVFMSPKNAQTATGSMLVGGEVDDLLPALETMTGTVQHIGADPTVAATLKLAGNGSFMVAIAGLGDLFRIGAANGVAPETILGMLKGFSPFTAGMGKRVLSDRPASFELTMARKDVRLMIDAAEGELAVLPAIADSMDAAIERGMGQADFAQWVKAP